MVRRLGLLLVLLLSGCAGDPSQPAGVETRPPTYEPPAFDETTGALDGLVVADDYAPIADARVFVTPGDRQAATDELGRFAFGALGPGTYQVEAHAIGYDSSARKVDVVAGAVQAVRIELTALALHEPYTTTQILNGKTTCTVSYRSSVNFLRPSCSTAAAAFPNDKWNLEDRARPGFVDVLIETSWRPTYSYGNELYQTVGGKPRDAFLHIEENEGPNPLRILINQTEWLAWADRHQTNFTEEGGTVSISTFAAHNLVGAPSPVQLGMVVDQGFTIYSTIAYNGPMPSGLTRVPDA